MSSQKVVRNYAESLFFNAQNANKEQECFEQISTFWSVMEKVDKAIYLLSSPVVMHDHKNKFIALVSKKMGFEKIVTQFLYILIKNSRILLLKEIIKSYSEVLAKSKGIKTVEVVSASKLGKVELDIISNHLAKELESMINIEVTEDNSLMGGVQIKYDSFIIDYSLQGMIDKVSKIARSTKID